MPINLSSFSADEYFTCMLLGRRDTQSRKIRTSPINVTKNMASERRQEQRIVAKNRFNQNHHQIYITLSEFSYSCRIDPGVLRSCSNFEISIRVFDIQSVHLVGQWSMKLKQYIYAITFSAKILISPHTEGYLSGIWLSFLYKHLSFHMTVYNGIC